MSKGSNGSKGSKWSKESGESEETESEEDEEERFKPCRCIATISWVENYGYLFAGDTIIDIASSEDAYPTDYMDKHGDSVVVKEFKSPFWILSYTEGEYDETGYYLEIFENKENAEATLDDRGGELVEIYDWNSLSCFANNDAFGNLHVHNDKLP